MYIIKLKNGQWILVNRVKHTPKTAILEYKDIFNTYAFLYMSDISTITPINVLR